MLHIRYVLKGYRSIKERENRIWNTFTGEITHELNIKGQKVLTLRRNRKDTILYTKQTSSGKLLRQKGNDIQRITRYLEGLSSKIYWEKCNKNTNFDIILKCEGGSVGTGPRNRSVCSYYYITVDGPIRTASDS